MSDLRKALADYLQLRRALGFKLLDSEHHLRKFITFLEEEGAEWITTELARAWATSVPGAQPGQWAARLRMVRLFARFRSGDDPRTEVPPLRLLPHRYERIRPHIYSSKEVRAIIDGARCLISPYPLRRLTSATLFGLLAVTGLRVGEAVALDDTDVDLEQDMLRIRRAKFGKTRLVPIHPSTSTTLRDYANHRDRLHRRSLTTPAFFVNHLGKRLSCQAARRAFREVSRAAGLRGPADRRGPRLHDFRHSFAVETIRNWYQNGRDVERDLPKLATYLGHTHWSETYWYLTSVPELMSLACDRLEQAHRRLP